VPISVPFLLGGQLPGLQNQKRVKNYNLTMLRIVIQMNSL
jgi:hypothetical protein